MNTTVLTLYLKNKYLRVDYYHGIIYLDYYQKTKSGKVLRY